MTLATIVGWIIKRVPGPVLVYVGAGLLIALGASMIALSVQSARLDAAIAERDAANAQLISAQSAAAAAADSATQWQTLAEDLAARLTAELAEAQARAKRGAEAVARARQRERDADATLRGWLDRYADATRAAECAAIERMKVCEVDE